MIEEKFVNLKCSICENIITDYAIGYENKNALYLKKCCNCHNLNYFKVESYSNLYV